MHTWLQTALLSLLLIQSSSDKRPEGWKVRLDRPGAFSSEPYFVTMAPGWHITTGPSILAYEAAATARGNFRVESEIMLFPGAPNDGYGLFVGGSSLDTNELSYTAFQLRRDGRFSIWFRSGSTTKDIVTWTAHPAIVPHTGQNEPIRNTLAIEVRPAEVAFLVNNRPVHVSRRVGLVVEGNYGFRVHENLNVHPTGLSLKPVP